MRKGLKRMWVDSRYDPKFWIVTVSCLLVGIALAVCNARAAADKSDKVWSTASIVVPVAATIVAADPAPADPMKRKFSRADRKLAKEVIRDAAESMGLSRREFVKGVRAEQAKDYKGMTPHTDELKMSLAMHDGVGEIDIDRLREILQMIFQFIAKLLAIFGFLI